MSQGKIVRDQLERAKARAASQAFMRLAGAVRGLRDLSSQGVLALVKGIADTGFLVAFANRGDRHHEWAVGVAEGVTEPLLTCEAVPAETAFHLRSAAQEMVREGLVALAFDCRNHLPQLAASPSATAASPCRRPSVVDSRHPGCCTYVFKLR